MSAEQLLITAVGLAAMVGFLVVGIRDAIRWRRDRASLRRIRARVFPHGCPLCGIVHGGVGQ